MSAIAKPEIPTAPRREILHFNWGNTDNIVSVIMGVANKEHLGNQVAKFSENFRAKAPGQQYDKLGELWAYVRNNIPYVPDPVGIQQIKHPARTWEDAERGEGSDCKSMSVFIRFCLYNLGIPHCLRFASYVPNKRIQHVYCVAFLDGQEVILDTVYDKFDEEVEYTHKTDKKPERMTKIVEIAGLPANIQIPERPWFPISTMSDGELALAAAVRELELVTAINKGRGFASQAEEQERALDQMAAILQKGLHRANIKQASGKLQPLLYKLQRREFASWEAFQRSTPRIAGGGNEFALTAAQRAECDSLVEYTDTLVDPFTGEEYGGEPTRESQEAYEKCTREKRMENVVNAHIIDSGVNFLYDQMGPDNAYRAIIAQKLLNQSSWVYEAARVTGLSEENIRAIARTGTIEKLGETPESARAILYAAMTQNNVGFDPIAIATLITAIISFIGAGVQLIRQFQAQSEFKQAFEDIPDPGSPNFKIAGTDFAVPLDSAGNPITPGQQGSGGNSNFIQMGLLAAGAYLILS